MISDTLGHRFDLAYIQASESESAWERSKGWIAVVVILAAAMCILPIIAFQVYQKTRRFEDEADRIRENIKEVESHIEEAKRARELDAELEKDIVDIEKELADEQHREKETVQEIDAARDWDELESLRDALPDSTIHRTR